ncbi:MAG: hypothetical protein Kow0068_09340 [Marinilabiliales bacterium]
MSLNTHGKKGRVAKTITVMTNDPSQPVIYLKLDGEVIQEQKPTSPKLENPNSPVKINN